MTVADAEKRHWQKKLLVDDRARPVSIGQYVVKWHGSVSPATRGIDICYPKEKLLLEQWSLTWTFIRTYYIETPANACLDNICGVHIGPELLLRSIPTFTQFYNQVDPGPAYYMSL